MYKDEEIASAVALELYNAYRRNHDSLDILTTYNAIKLSLSCQPKNLTRVITLVAFNLEKFVREYLQLSPQARRRIEEKPIYIGPKDGNRIDVHIQNVINALRGGFVLLAAATKHQTIKTLKEDAARMMLDCISDTTTPQATVDFLVELTDEIKRIEGTSYGEPSLRDAKVIALLQLKLLAIQSRSAGQAIDRFKVMTTEEGQSYYHLISTHRRTGCLSFFNFGRTSSQQLIDKYSSHNTTSERVQLMGR